MPPESLAAPPALLEVYLIGPHAYMLPTVLGTEILLSGLLSPMVPSNSDLGHNIKTYQSCVPMPQAVSAVQSKRSSN